MAKGVRVKKYSRRTSSRRGGGRVWLVIFAVAAFIALSLALSVAIGISLGKRADALEDKGGYELPKVEYLSGGKSVRGVVADLFDSGRLPGSERDVSVILRREDGELTYSSSIARSVGFDSCGEEELSSYADGVHYVGGYLCGVFYVRSFAEEDEGLREIYKAYELSLISEAAECGVDDILLVGIGVGSNNVAEVEEFLMRAALAAKEAPIGVCVGRASFSTSEQEQYLALRLRAACDYFALDTGSIKVGDGMSADEAVRLIADDVYYYIEEYSLRLVFSDGELYSAAEELGLNNIQLIGK